MFLASDYSYRFPCVVHTVDENGVTYYEFFINQGGFDGEPTLHHRDKPLDHWICLDMERGHRVPTTSITVQEVQEAYYAHIAPPTEQQETAMTDASPAFEVKTVLSTGRTLGWSVKNERDAYAAYSTMAALFDSITRQKEASDRVQVVSDSSVEYIPSNLVTTVSINDLRTPEERERTPFAHLVRRYAAENRHTVDPKPNVGVSQLGEAVWVWWNEAGFAGGVGTTQEEAEAQLAVYAEQLNTNAEPENAS